LILSQETIRLIPHAPVAFGMSPATGRRAKASRSARQPPCENRILLAAQRQSQMSPPVCGSMLSKKSNFPSLDHPEGVSAPSSREEVSRCWVFAFSSTTEAEARGLS
jgi:hypothetical protein